MRLTDTTDTETLLRLIQSTPSKKAEPIKLWLAKVGHERPKEIQDPEQSVNRARENWKRHGMSEKWKDWTRTRWRGKRVEALPKMPGLNWRIKQAKKSSLTKIIFLKPKGIL